MRKRSVHFETDKLNPTKIARKEDDSEERVRHLHSPRMMPRAGPEPGLEAAQDVAISCGLEA